MRRSFHPVPMHKLIFTIQVTLIALGSFAQKASDQVIYKTSDSANYYILKFNEGYKNATELIVQTISSREQEKYIVNTIRSSRYQLVMIPQMDSSTYQSKIFIVALPEEKMKLLAGEIQGNFVTESKQVAVAFKLMGVQIPIVFAASGDN